MSASNFLTVDTNAPYKDIYCNLLGTQSVSTGSVVASGLVQSASINTTDIQVLNHIALPAIVPLSLSWAGVDQVIACSKPSGHVIVSFSGTSLTTGGGAGSIARFQLTNADFGQTFGGSIVSKGPFTGAGESLGARLIDVCVSFRAPGALTVAIINNGSLPYGGNVEFDFAQF